MAINLQKGQTIDLRKNDKGDNYDLSTLTIGLGWDVREKNGFFSKLLGAKEEEYDLDAIAFLLDGNGKVVNLGEDKQWNSQYKSALFKSDVIYFNNVSFPNGTGTAQMVYPNTLSKSQMIDKVNTLLRNGETIVHTGDNLTGEGDGDDEQIIVKLDSLPQRVQKILFLACIYQGEKKNQHFGMIDNAFIRAVDAKGKEIAKYSLSGTAFSGMCSMVFAEAYRKEDSWKLRALGEPHRTDSFIEILKTKLQ